MRIVRRSRTAPCFAALILGLVPMLAGCKKEGRIVDAASGEPIPNAQVTMQSRVSSIARGPMGRAVGDTTDPEGRYAFEKIEGEFDFVSAWAPDYYPNASYEKGGDGEVRLTRVPHDAIPMRKGLLPLEPGKPTRGFDLHTGQPAPIEESDIILTWVTASGSGALRLESVGYGGIYAYIGKGNPRKSFEFNQVLEAPKTGYRTAVNLTPETQYLFVRCRDGYHFARLYLAGITQAARNQTEALFGYCIQADGSRRVPPRPIYATDLELARCGVPGQGEPK